MQSIGVAIAGALIWWKQVRALLPALPCMLACQIFEIRIGADQSSASSGDAIQGVLVKLEKSQMNGL